MVKLIDVSSLEQRIKNDFDVEQYEDSIKANLVENHGKLNEEERKNTKKEEDWSDNDDDSDDDSDMSDDSDD
jgi:hypothetical protein